MTSDLLNTNPTVTIQIDRQRAAVLGVALRRALKTRWPTRSISSKSHDDLHGHERVLGGDGDRATSPARCQRPPALLHVPGTGEQARSPSVMWRSSRRESDRSASLTPGKLASVTISFNLVTGASLGTAVTQVEQAARATLPASITTGFAGTLPRRFQASQKGLGLPPTWSSRSSSSTSFLASCMRASSHPVTILTGLPFGHIWRALRALRDEPPELDVYGYVRHRLMLIGIVKKNAIMMIDFAIAAEREGHTSRPKRLSRPRVSASAPS